MKLFIVLCLVSICYSERDAVFRFERRKRSVITTDVLDAEGSGSSALSLTPSLLSRLGSDNGVVCCECVPFFLCDGGKIITDGGGALDVRIGGVPTTTPAPTQNVEVCPNLMDICCLVPDADPVCLGEPITTEPPPDNYFTPPPDSECECLPYTSCPPNLVVSDGLGHTSLELANGRLVNHSRCAHALDVCCYLPVIIDIRPPTIDITPPTSPPTSGNIDEHPCECVSPFMCTSDGFIRTDGAGVLDLRIRPHTPPKPCPQDPNLVCCRVPESEVETPVVPTKPPPTSPPTSGNIDEHPCECVPPFMCTSDGFIRTNGAGVLDLRIGPPTPPKPCPQNPNLVCCRVPESKVETTPAPPTKPPPPPTSPPTSGNIDEHPCECVPPFMCTSDGFIRTEGSGVLDLRIGPPTPPKPCPQDPNLVCCRVPESEGETTPPPTPPPTFCGKRNFNGVGVRILGFKDGQTQFGEFPWVATLLKTEFMAGKEVSLFQGGASLIHKRIAMTAAHKVQDIPVHSLVVRLGEWDVVSTKESRPYQDVRVERVINHPGYVNGPLYHDVALLILEEEAKLDFHISPICPAKSLDDIIPSTCLINGWGVDAYRSENYQQIMKSVELPLVGKAKCQTLLRKTRLSRFFKLHNSFICAGGEEGVDSCKGDGGGPLACQSRHNPSQYFQVGITAWGIGCGTKDVPGVYADVAVHYDWIMEQIAELFPKTNLEDHPGGTGTPALESPTLSAEEKKKLRQQRRRERRKEQEKRRRRQKNRRG